MLLVCGDRSGALGPAAGRRLADTLRPAADRLGAELVPLCVGEPDLPGAGQESPAGGHGGEQTRGWSRIAVGADGADGFVLVIPEHDHGMPATVRRALALLGPVWAGKPVGFVVHGQTPAGRHTRRVVTALRPVPSGATVAAPAGGALRDERSVPAARRAGEVEAVLEELVVLARARLSMREREHPSAEPGPLAGSRVRRLLPDDAPEVTVLQRCCWTEEALANDTLDIPALHESPDDVRAWLADWQADGLWRDGRLLGMVRTRRDGADLHVGRLAVAPALRGRGVGRWLLARAETAGEGCRRIVLSTGAASHRNLGLYRRQGYVPLPGAEAAAVVSLAKAVPC